MTVFKELNSLQRCSLDPLKEEEDNSHKSGAPTTTTTTTTNTTSDPPGILVSKEEEEEESQHLQRQRQRQRQQKPFKLYGATFICLTILERWLEFGDRPSTETIFHYICTILVMPDDENGGGSRRRQSEEEEAEEIVQELQRMWNDPVDDVKKLRWVVDQVRRVLLWNRAPDPSLDLHLTIQESMIPNAQLGLFANRDLPAHAICCYYSGDVHSIKSSQSTTNKMLKDPSYLLRIGFMARQPWWYQSLLPAGTDDDDDDDDDQDDDTTGEASSTSSSSSVYYGALREEWDRIIAVTATTTTEFFVDPSTNPEIKARYINDCLISDKYNVQFVMDPIGERAAVVTLRPIQRGEELYVSYGQAYWDSIEATTGIVPQKLLV